MGLRRKIAGFKNYSLHLNGFLKNLPSQLEQTPSNPSLLGYSRYSSNLFCQIFQKFHSLHEISGLAFSLTPEHWSSDPASVYHTLSLRGVEETNDLMIFLTIPARILHEGMDFIATHPSVAPFGPPVTD
jgi:hypothetical protein